MEKLGVLFFKLTIQSFDRINIPSTAAEPCLNYLRRSFKLPQPDHSSAQYIDRFQIQPSSSHGNYVCAQVYRRQGPKASTTFAYLKSYVTGAAARKNAHKSRQHSGPFRFLDLPPELRNCIYQYLFTAEDHYESGTWTLMPPTPSTIESDFEYGFDEDRSVLAILQTCKQINGEARTIPFYCNTIRFTDVQIMAETGGYMDGDRISAIKCIEIDLSFK
jgi:hypothetical protein